MSDTKSAAVDYFASAPLKVALLGDSGVGKTSLLMRLVHDTFDHAYSPTCGMSFLRKTIHLDGQAVQLELLEISGRERYRYLIPTYIRDSSVAIVLYDITDRASFNSIRNWVDEVRSKNRPGVIIALVGNQADLSHKRQVTVEEATQRASELDVMFMETSARAGHNVKTLFEKVALSFTEMEKDGTNADRANNMSLHKSASPENDTPIPLDSEGDQHSGLKADLLRRAGWLHGFRVDGVSEPRISAYQVASYVDGAAPFVEDLDTSNLSTDIYHSSNEREANYCRRGWSREATTTISSWTSARIGANNQPSAELTAYTRITKKKIVKVEVLLEELTPVPDFQAAIEEALTRPTTFERF